VSRNLLSAKSKALCFSTGEFHEMQQDSLCPLRILLLVRVGNFYTRWCYHSAQDINKRMEVARITRSRDPFCLLKPGIRLPEMRWAANSASRKPSCGGSLARPGRLWSCGEVPKSRLFVSNSPRMILWGSIRYVANGTSCLRAGGGPPEPQQDLQAMEACLADMRAAAASQNFSSYSSGGRPLSSPDLAAQPNRFLEKSLETVCCPCLPMIRSRAPPPPPWTMPESHASMRWYLTALQTGDTALRPTLCAAVAALAAYPHGGLQRIRSIRQSSVPT